MIATSELDFPQNAVALIATAAKLIDKDLEVVKRPLRTTDPSQSVGVYGAQWAPEEDSYEMRGGLTGPGPSEPTLQRYLVTIQAFIRDSDEQRGLATHSLLAKLVRTMLYRDATLRVGLAALASTTGESTERARRWGVQTQAMHSNELSGSWLYLSTLGFWLETETV